MHENVSDSVISTARWLDDFFAMESIELDEEARGGARIQLAWEPRSRDIMEFETRVRVRVKLPQLKNQVDLVFSDYDEELEKAPVKAAQNEFIANQNRFNLALRWIKRKDDKGFWSNRIGVGRQLQPFARSRYSRIFEINEDNNIRTEASIYYYSKDGFGSHLGLQYEHDWSEDTVFRFDNNFYYRDEDDDWLWQHSLYGLEQLSEESALVYGVYLEGLSQPTYRLEEYLVSTRWRKNALREWLFFEVEPFILWRRDENFSASYGVALRVEGYFGQY